MVNKSCPRCIHGQIMVDSDERHRWYEFCLQCGYTRDLKYGEVPTQIQPTRELVKVK